MAETICSTMGAVLRSYKLRHQGTSVVRLMHGTNLQRLSYDHRATVLSLRVVDVFDFV